MIINKMGVNKGIFSLLLLILISVSLLVNYSSLANAESYNVKYADNLDDKSLEISDRKDLTLTDSYSSVTINLKKDVTVTTPNGSRITNISSKSMDIQLGDDNRTVDFSDTVNSFSNISFRRSIDGLDEFKVKIDFVNYKKQFSSDSDIVAYTVEWGNGELTTGVGVSSSSVSYVYKKEGTYPVSIKLVDRNGITYRYLKNQSFKLTADKFVVLWVDENKETVAAGSAGIGGVALLGFALTETGKYKLLALLPLLIPMYTRIQKEDVLDQFVRGEIYGFIKTHPGVHYNHIMRELDMKNGTLSYHLYMLEKTGMIKSRKEGFRYRAFYPTGMKFPEKERYRLTELQTNILKVIRETPGVNQKEIAKKLKEKHQTISYNIKVLQQADLISIQKKGRKSRCYIKEKLSNPET